MTDEIIRPYRIKSAFTLLTAILEPYGIAYTLCSGMGGATHR